MARRFVASAVSSWCSASVAEALVAIDGSKFKAVNLRDRNFTSAKLERRMRDIEESIGRYLLAMDTAVPGVGLLTATAAVATMGDAKVFRSGREFAAWAGLVPRQSGSGGKVNLHGISKRGDTYLRTLLIHGARAVLSHAKDAGPWIEEMRRRRPANVVIVALANKMARMIWAILAHDRPYQRDYVSRKPA
ncbi:hypothetical protein LMG28138_05239 [Pararobbsia alpina]|uniref:Transposase IS116/IS110/IS902 C-terminal domain-containing protein n=1 Tax=Pararobbsia alpina TaxID=621374 RepID=A0A6S7BJS0_9BURK|nr:hypothetical protein LMG28138_05239 [Pararobbsia alpina]